MLERSTKSELDHCLKQIHSGSRSRFLKMLASTGVLGLVITAPSFASDGGRLLPPLPGAPEIVVPDLGPAPTLSPDPEPVVGFDPGPVPGPPPVSDQAEPDETLEIVGLSPELDEPAAREGGAADVVSTRLEPDITPVADPVSITPPVIDDELSTPDLDASPPVPSVSPGDTSAAGPTDDSAGLVPSNEKGAAPSTPAESTSAAEPPASTPTGSSGPAPSVSELNSPRYQEKDSQYQSDEQSSQDPWHWIWSLTLDCNGNATSLSTQTGSRESLNWTWDWFWDWDCKSTDIGPNVTPSTSTSISGDNINVSVRVASPGESGSVTQSTASAGTADGVEATDESENGLWNWSWAFTFCGETTSYSTLLDSHTPLDWTWNWIWNWTCDAAPSAPPELADGVPPGADASSVPPLAAVIPAASAQPAPELVPVFRVDVPLTPRLPPLLGVHFVPSFDLPVPSVDVGVSVLVIPRHGIAPLSALSLPLPGVPGIDVAVLVVPTETSPTPASGDDPTRQQKLEAAGHSRAKAASSAPTTTMPILSQRPEAEPREPAATPATTRKHSAQPASPRQAREPLSPFGQSRSSETAGSSTFGGRVPSVPVAAVAALMAFFMLAAPRVGRRIRVVRELSPRGAHRSSIDHPG